MGHIHGGFLVFGWWMVLHIVKFGLSHSYGMGMENNAYPKYAYGHAYGLRPVFVLKPEIKITKNGEEYSLSV